MVLRSFPCRKRAGGPADRERGGRALSTLFQAITDGIEKYILQPFKQFSVWDAVDIILLAVLLYCVFLFFKGRRAGKLAVGLALIFGLYAVSDILGLRAVHRILEGIAPYSIILLAVIFQPELRDALEKLGNTPFGILPVNEESRGEISDTVNEVVDAVCRIAMSGKDGALIVIERTTRLGDYVAKGHPLDAVVTSDLLCNIFVDRSPLHDGAVVIRHNRIAAAGCKLPLSSNEELVKHMGTRHRAAIGISEVSDCVTVVVSEERHLISITNNGLIKRDYHRTPEELSSESSMKTIQNALRNDLFLLLTGVDFDEEQKSRKKRRSKPRKAVSRQGTKEAQPAESPASVPEVEEQLTIEAVLTEPEIPAAADEAVPAPAPASSPSDEGSTDARAD